MAEKSRFYLFRVDQGEGRKTVSLIPRWSSFGSPDPPSAFGAGFREAVHVLHDQCRDRFDEDPDELRRFRWSEKLACHRTTVEIHPSTQLGALSVLGRRTVPLSLTYGLAPLADGGCRMVVPRFDVSLVIEDESLAKEVIHQQLPAWLAGIESASLFDFRPLGEESIEPWRPSGGFRPRGHGSEPQDDELETLRAVAEDWVDRARRRRLEPVVDVFDPAEHNHAYDRFPPESILLVGRQGVGKTAWVRALAHYFLRWQRDRDRDDPPRLWATSADRLMAGMSYLGQWEERCLEIADEISFEGDYIYVGRLRPILERRGHSSIGELWREAVEDEQISLIAECTPEELETCRRLLPGLVRRMRILRLEEPSLRRVPDWVRAYAARKAKSLELRESALRRMTYLLDAYRRHEVFPGKAFRFVDVLAREAEEKHASRGDHDRDSRDPVVLTADGVTEAFCRWSGLPKDLISDRRGRSVQEIASALAAGVVGQDHACEAAARILARFKAGLHDPEKPLGTLLFVGPTGVGKTELAKQLATYMFGHVDRLLRFDMSEFQTPGSSRRLLQVGEGRRSLAQDLRRQPLSLVLFDEIEKAHPEVFDLLLGVLGEGRLTDSEGRVVDFRMSILVMTSNLGVRETESPGFGDGRAGHADYSRAVRRHFRPELVNRIDEIVSFRNLALRDVEKIVDLSIRKARHRPGIAHRRLSLHLEPAARALLAKRGVHPTRGARPLQRLIEEEVLTPLAIKISEDPALTDRAVYIVDDPSARVPPGSELIAVSPAPEGDGSGSASNTGTKKS